MSLVLPSGMHVSAARKDAAIARPGMSTTAFVGEFPANFGSEPRVVASWKEAASLWGRSRTPRPIEAALEGYFANGGTVAVCCPVSNDERWKGDRHHRFAEALRESQRFEDIGLVCAPGETDPSIQELLIEHCESMRDRFAILDGPADLGVGTVHSILRPRESAWSACYFPWVLSVDAEGGVRCVPPSGHVAGVFARVEAERGVGRRPTNEIMRRVSDVRYALSRSEQDALESAGFNVIRHLGERGVRVLGDRTMANESAWSSIATRRLSLMIMRAIRMAGQRDCVESDDDAASLQRSLATFLAGLQADGFLAGSAPAEGFSVSCSVDGSMDPRLICRVDIAPEKPGEFVSFSTIVPLHGWAMSTTNEAGSTSVRPAS